MRLRSTALEGALADGNQGLAAQCHRAARSADFATSGHALKLLARCKRGLNQFFDLRRSDLEKEKDGVSGNGSYLP